MTESVSVYAFGTVCEQGGKCAMGSDGKRFRGLCVCAVCSPHAMTFYSMRTFISTSSLHGRGADGTERGLSLRTCDLLTTHTLAHSADFALVVFVRRVSVCVFTVLLPVWLMRGQEGG